MALDLEMPRFSQRQVLTLLPFVSAKALQNWAARGITSVGEQAPGKQGRRLYSVLDIIQLDHLAELIRLGIPPTQANEIATIARDFAPEYWTKVKSRIHRYPPGVENPPPDRIVMDFGELSSMRRIRVTAGSGGVYISTVSRPNDSIVNGVPNDVLIGPMFAGIGGVEITVHAEHKIALMINRVIELYGE